MTALVVGCGVAVILLACANPRMAPAEAGRARGVAMIARSFTERGLIRLTADMDPAMLALARRHDPLNRQADPWGRAVGWTSLDIRQIPDLGRQGR